MTAYKTHTGSLTDRLNPLPEYTVTNMLRQSDKNCTNGLIFSVYMI